MAVRMQIKTKQTSSAPLYGALTNLPINFTFDFQNVKKHFDAGQFRCQRQGCQVEHIFYIQVGSRLVRHVECRLQINHDSNVTATSPQIIKCVRQILCAYNFFVDDQHMQNCISVRISIIGIASSCQYQSVAFLLAQTCCKTERILAPVDVTANVYKITCK